MTCLALADVFSSGAAGSEAAAASGAGGGRWGWGGRGQGRQLCARAHSANPALTSASTSLNENSVSQPSSWLTNPLLFT